MERTGSAHEGEEVQKEKGWKERIREGREKSNKRERESRVFLPKVVAAPESTQRAVCPRGDKAREGAAPLSSSGRRGRACRGGLATEPLRREPVQPGVHSAQQRPPPPARTCVRVPVPVRAGSRVGWEWRSPRRGWGRHAFRCGVGALASELLWAPPAGFLPPERPGRPRSGPAELSTSPPGAAARLCGSALRGTWQTLPGRAGGGGPPSGSPEGRLLPPLVQPPRAASAHGPGSPPPVPPAAPSTRPAAEPARPVRDGALGRLSRRSARPPRAGEGAGAARPR